MKSSESRRESRFKEKRLLARRFRIWQETHSGPNRAPVNGCPVLNSLGGYSFLSGDLPSTISTWAGRQITPFSPGDISFSGDRQVRISHCGQGHRFGSRLWQAGVFRWCQQQGKTHLPHVSGHETSECVHGARIFFSSEQHRKRGARGRSS